MTGGRLFRTALSGAVCRLGWEANEHLVEVNVRQAVFYPSQPGLNYITVNGFVLEQAATPWAPPTAEQVGLIGTHWSKGWRIENNTIRYAQPAVRQR